MKNIKILQRVAEIEKDRYVSSGDYSVTSLIDPPRVTRLRKRHAHEVDQPLKNVLPAIIGTAVHNLFEQSLKKWAAKHGYGGYTFEEELKVVVRDRVVSGRYDIRDNRDITDIKTCKAWKVVFDPGLVDWHKQQNSYAYLLKEYRNIEVNNLFILALFKDWQENMSLRNPQYPKAQAIEYELTKWPYKIQKEYVEDRLNVHRACEELEDHELPPCTRDERWERFSGGHQVEYAIMKSATAKKAAKVIRTDLNDAYTAAKSMKGITKDSFIEVRYARRTRCEDYCSVNAYCNDYLYYIKAKKNNALNDIIPLL